MMTLSRFLSSVRTRGLGPILRALSRELWAGAQRLRGWRFVEIAVYDYRMLVDLEDRGISRTLLLFRERELEHKIMLERVLKPGMTVLDIGANIGYYALMELRLIGPRGQLIAVEPSPSNVALLKKNLALNGYDGIEVHQLAVSDRADKRPFFMSEMSNLNTFHDTGTGSLHLKGETIEVSTASVPEIAAGRKIDLIRMDVEGHEVEVLNGVLPAIERGEIAPMIIFETHLSRYSSDHDIEPPLRRLFEMGYRVSLAGTSSERGTELVERLGYRAQQKVRSDDVERAIVSDVLPEHAIRLIRHEGGLRTVLLAPGSPSL